MDDSKKHMTQIADHVLGEINKKGVGGDQKLAKRRVNDRFK